MPVLLFAAWLLVAAMLAFAWHDIERRRVPVLVGVLLLSTVHQLMFATLAEDAFISFRYSANLAEGNGLVFNAGEKVEGYSNFLWVVLVAGPHALFNADIVTTARVLGVMCTLACVVVGYVLTRRITGHSGAGLLAATMIAAASSLAAYGPSGLETPLFALLVLLVLLAVQANRPLVAGLLVALATMTRPDGVVVAVVVGFYLLIRIRGARGANIGHDRQRDWWTVPWYVLGAAVLAGPWTAWRVSYYGHLTPNAIAAKSGASTGWLLENGLVYLSGFAVAAQALLLLVPLAVFAMLKRRAAGLPALIIVLAVVYVGFFVATGGDWMPAWRFFAPAMPLLAVGCVSAVALAWPVRTRAAPVLAASVAALLLVASVWQPTFKRTIDLWHDQVNDLSATGDWVRATLPEGATIATFANGALSYQAGTDVTVVDLLGLTDEHIARAGKRDLTGMIGHQAQDYEYVINKRRPLVVFTSGTGYALAESCQVDARFGDKYRAALFRVTGQQLWLTVLLRRDQAEDLAARMDADPDYEQARWCD